MTLLTKKKLAQAREYYSDCSGKPLRIDPRVEALVHELIGRVADKWTMILLETLPAECPMRFMEISKAVGGISQKMLTQTLRQMERDGLVERTVYPVIPPKVEYRLTKLGLTLSEAFCGVWVWAGEHLAKVEAARQEFDARDQDKRSPRAKSP